MYVLQDKPGKFYLHASDDREAHHAVATLKDGHGGIAHIYTDDHCYVLALASENAWPQVARPSYHWFPEAVEVLKTLPLP